MTEAERAAAWRQEHEARCQAKRERIEALAGDPAAAASVRAAWLPPLLAAQEARAPIDPCADDLCLTPDEEALLAN